MLRRKTIQWMSFSFIWHDHKLLTLEVLLLIPIWTIWRKRITPIQIDKPSNFDVKALHMTMTQFLLYSNISNIWHRLLWHIFTCNEMKNRNKKKQQQISIFSNGSYFNIIWKVFENYSRKPVKLLGKSFKIIDFCSM